MTLEKLRKANSKIENVISITKKINEAYNEIAYFEALIKDENGLADLGFRFNEDIPYCPDSLYSYIVGFKIPIIFGQIKEFLETERALYDSLSRDEINSFIIALRPLNGLVSLTKYDIVRINRRLTERANVKGFNPYQGNLVDEVLGVAEIDRFMIQKAQLDECVQEDLAISGNINEHTEALQRMQVFLKYMRLSYRSSYLEKKALDANFDIYSISIKSHEDIKAALADDDTVSTYFISFTMNEIKKYIEASKSLAENGDKQQAYNMATYGTFITALINLFPKFMLVKLLASIKGKFSGEYIDEIIQYINGLLESQSRNPPGDHIK